MPSFVEECKKAFKQQDLQLFHTKCIAHTIRIARKKNLPSEVIEELFRLLWTTAKYEWGPETIVDDFSIEGKFLIKNGSREDLI